MERRTDDDPRGLIRTATLGGPGSWPSSYHVTTWSPDFEVDPCSSGILESSEEEQDKGFKPTGPLFVRYCGQPLELCLISSSSSPSSSSSDCSSSRSTLPGGPSSEAILRMCVRVRRGDSHGSIRKCSLVIPSGSRPMSAHFVLAMVSTLLPNEPSWGKAM